MRINKYSAVLIAAMVAAVSAQAANIDWDNGGVGNDWSNPTNWNAGNISFPSSNADTARYVGNSDADINVDQDVTAQAFVDGNSGAGFATTVGGPGTLTIDRNLNNASGLANSTGNAGGTLKFTGQVTINNSAGGRTYVANGNSAGNITVFDTASTLTLTTALNATGTGSHQFNGTLAGSAGLGIAATNVSFGAGHDSSGYTGDIVLNGSGKNLTINGGTVGNSGVDIVSNYGTQFLELNGANAINGANIRQQNNPSFPSMLTLDVNAGQNNMGTIDINSATSVLTIDIADLGIGEELWFADSSGVSWTAGGTIVINGFQEGVIKFGSDANGLSAGQLSAIDGGIYSLDSGGYLIPEPSTLGLIAMTGMGLLVARRMRL